MDSFTNVSSVDFVFQANEETTRIKYIVLFIFQIISISCYLFIFYNFATKRNRRRTIHNDSIFCLLTISFLFVVIPLSISESYLSKSYIVPGSNIFCGLWNWLQYSLDVSNLHLMAYASMERHLLIFYPAGLQGKWRRRLFHTYPLVFSIAYPTIFYFIVIFFTDCQIVYDFTQLLCTWPCYFDIWPLTIYDTFFNTLIPLFVVPVFFSCSFISCTFGKNVLCVLKYLNGKEIGR